jgi:DNA-binding GntR family transcriptional regulator
MNSRNTVNITNSTLNNSAVAGRDAAQRTDASQRTNDLSALRTALAEAAGEIAGHASTPERRADVEHELRKMDQEVRAEAPDGAKVRFRWRSVLEALDGAVVAGTRIGQITELVHRLFGG